jgi:diguanylate cyclase (GGDEF)-like protein/PAS domain S-box-containing protein
MSGVPEMLATRALEAVPGGIAVADAIADGLPLVYVNPAFERLTGVPAYRALGAPCAHALGGSPGPNALEALRAGETWRDVLPLRLPDGTPAEVELALAPVRNGSGQLVQVIALVGDAAERAVPASAPSDAEERYRGLIEQIPAVTYISDFDEAGTLRWLSPQVEALLGYPPEAFLADDALWDRLIHPEDRLRVTNETARVFREEREFDCEFRMIAADGRELHVWERDAIVRDREGRPLLTQGVLVDVTPLHSAEEALRAERDRAQSYLDVAGAIMLALDRDGRIRMLNRAGHELLGYHEGELIGADWFETCLPAADRAEWRSIFDQVVAGKLPSREHAENGLLTRDGRVRIVEWRNRLLHDDEGRVITTLSSGLDVTERRAAEERIAHMAYHDSLTGLPNRALLREHLEPALARARRAGRSVALMYLDLDDFKAVNDSFGHDAGDELLNQVAERLRERQRASDVLARQSGDEFMLLITDLSGDPSEATVSAAGGMLDTLSEPFKIGNESFHVSGSIGISIFPRDADDADTLLRHADAAMYEAKSEGRSGVMRYEQRPTASADRLSLTTRLRSAVKRGELRLHWQPIVAPADGALHAVEALVRWQDPARGLVAPAEFIPIAEETGLIEEIGAWVVDAIAHQRAAWRGQGADPRVHLNVSPRELRYSYFADRMLDRIASHGQGLDGMTIEITETVAMRERERTEPMLRKLAEAGARIAIDDFGSGYSSLTRLRELPVTVLKLDRAFLADVPEKREAAAVVTAVIELAAALDMTAVAEGVETEAQRAFLVARGCPFAQGYLLGRPAPAAELAALVAGSGAGVGARPAGAERPTWTA